MWLSVKLLINSKCIFSNVKTVYLDECQKVDSVNLGVSPTEKATSRWTESALWA